MAAGPARAQHGSLWPHDLGLHEQLAEGGVQCVRGRRCQGDFDVARDLHRPALVGAVDEPDAAQLDVVLGRDHDLRARLDQRTRDAVPAMELRTSLGEDRLVALGPTVCVGCEVFDQNTPLAVSRM